MTEKETILIFSGYNQRAVVAFLRTLESNHLDNYKIVALTESDGLLKSAYKKKICYVRTSKELNVHIFGQILDEIRRNGSERFFIIPSSEFFNRFFLDNREAIEKLGCRIPLVDGKLYEFISDKHSFRDHCRANGILVPPRLEWPKVFERALVAKPIRYVSQNRQIYSPVIIRSKEEWEDFRMKYPLSDFYAEEYLEGESYYLLYYFCASGEVHSFSQENLVQQPFGKSIVAARTSGLHRQDISAAFRRLFCELGFRGLVMVEVRKALDQYYMIDTNPRLWGPSQLFVDAGCNFFEVLLVENGLLEKEIVFEERPALYFWNGGVHQAWNTGEPLQFFPHGQELLFDRYDEWIRNDIYRREDTRALFLTGK